jgi:small subunit ribosomal protein S12
VRIATPKKPNSARRPVAKITLSDRTSTVSHIPGVGHNLRKHSKVLINGNQARDLPGINTTCIRGVYDFAGVLHKKRRRSIYGVKLAPERKKHIRRKFRLKNALKEK